MGIKKIKTSPLFSINSTKKNLAVTKEGLTRIVQFNTNRPHGKFFGFFSLSLLQLLKKQHFFFPHSFSPEKSKKNTLK
jgi:hypothetical protein